MATPKGRYSSPCFLCHCLIDKGEARARPGAPGSKVYHSRCAPFRENGFNTLEEMLGSDGECEGWNELNESDKRAAKKLIGIASRPTASGPRPNPRNPSNPGGGVGAPPGTPHGDVKMEPAPSTPAHTVTLPTEYHNLDPSYEDLCTEDQVDLPAQPTTTLNHADWTQSLFDFASTVRWEHIHEKYSTLNPPPQCTSAVSHLRSDVATLINNHTQAQSYDEAKCGAAWKILLLLDRMVFFKKRQQRGGKGQAKSAAILVSARVRGIYEGNWADVWTDSFSALATEAAPTQTEGKRLNLDVQLIRIALQDEDTRAALRVTAGKASMAPESKAIRSLPSMFPKGQVPCGQTPTYEPR